MVENRREKQNGRGRRSCSACQSHNAEDEPSDTSVDFRNGPRIRAWWVLRLYGSGKQFSLHILRQHISEHLEQVLQGFKNDNGVYSLYVTDFTKNTALLNNGKWPPRREDMVLKIEMWDAAASRGPSLKNRGYYLLENCRMLNQEKYLQAKMVEPKIRELSKEDEKDRADPRFAELLKYVVPYFLAAPICQPTCRREGEFEKGNDLPMTLENAPDESFCTCIVEVRVRGSHG